MGKFKNNLLAVSVFLLLVIAINTVMYLVLAKQKDLYQNLAVSLIISWVILVIAYYVWAIQFYNINMGWTDEEWKANNEKKSITPELAEPEPHVNPNAAESLGLPPGTVRATIALSLLVAGLSMTIATLSMENTHKPDLVFTDNFEFFKTAFIMMIAFYFGAKSLEFLDKKRKPDATAVNAGDAANIPSKSETTSSAGQVPIDASPGKIDDRHQPEDNTGSASGGIDIGGTIPAFGDKNSQG